MTTTERTQDPAVEQAARLVGAYGSVEGRVETLTRRHGLGFTLYDSLHDRAVRCHVAPEQSEDVRDAWGRRAIVWGWVRRDPTSGRPVSIDPVRSIEILPEVKPGSFQRARGIAPAGPEEPSTEVVIRRVRDA